MSSIDVIVNLITRHNGVGVASALRSEFVGLRTAMDDMNVSLGQNSRELKQGRLAAGVFGSAIRDSWKAVSDGKQTVKDAATTLRDAERALQAFQALTPADKVAAGGAKELSRLKTEVLNARTALDNARDALDSAVDYHEARLAKLSQAYMGVGAAALGAGVVFAGFATVTGIGVSQAADLESELVRLKIATQANSDAMPIMTQAINEMAVKTVFGSTDAAQAFELLSEKGFDVSQVIYGTGAAADEYKKHAYDATEATKGLGYQALVLAQAMKASATDGADLLGSSLHVFEKEGLSAQEVANDLAGAYFNGIPSASDLGNAINMAGAQAATSGIHFKDFLTTLDLLVQSGLSASSAGASLNYMIQSLIAPTQKQTAALSELGIYTVNTGKNFKDFEGKLRAAGAAGAAASDNFDGSVKSLRDMFTAGQNLHLIPLDETFNIWAEKTGILSSKLFDAKGNFVGMKPAIEILDQAMSDAGYNTQEKMDILGELFNVRSGRAARVLTNISDFSAQYDQIFGRIGSTDVTQAAQEQLDTLKGAFDAFKDSALSALAVALLPWLKHATDFINKLNDLIQKFQELPQPVKEAAGGFLLAATALSGLAFFILSAVAALGFLTLGLGAASGILEVLAPILGAVAVGLGLVAALAKVAADFWADLNTKGTWANEHLKPILDWIIQRFKDFKDFLGDEVVPTLKRLWDALEPVRGLLELLAKVYLVMVGGAWLAVIGIILGAIVVVTKIVEAFLTLKDKVGEVAAWVGEHWDQLWNDHLKPVFDGLGTKIDGARGHLDDLRDKVEEIWNKIVGWFDDIKKTWDTTVGPVFDDMKKTAKDVRDAWVNAWTDITGASDQGNDHLVKKTKETDQKLKVEGDGFALWLAEHWVKLVQSSRTLEGLDIIVPMIFRQLRTQIYLILGQIGVDMKNAWTLMQGNANIQWQGIVRDIKLNLSWIKNAVKGDLTFLGQFMAIQWNQMKTDAKTIWFQIQWNISQIWSAIKLDFMMFILSIKMLMGQLGASILDPIRNLGKSMQDAGRNLIDMLKRGIIGGLPDLRGAVNSVAGTIRDILGWHSPTKEGPGRDSDQWAPNLMRMMARGIRDNRGLLAEAGSLAAGDIARGLSAVPGTSRSLAPASGVSGALQPINVYVGNELVYEGVMDHLAGQLRPRGINRLGR